MLTTNEILDKVLEIKKGSWVKLVKSKDLGMGITKYTSMVVRLGVAYSHIKRVGKTTSTSGEGKLPWGEWKIDNLVISHKGELYLRVANAYTKATAKSWYVKDNKEISKAMVVELVGEQKSSESAVYNIKFRNIVSIG